MKRETAAIQIDDVDVERLRKRYSEERARRLNSSHMGQYAEVEGDLDHFRDDSYLETRLVRDPVDEIVEVLVIGGGFGGLLAAGNLKKIGIDDIRILDKAGDFGGVWYWNRYPGAQCDIESYIYLPMLEDVGYAPKEKYAYAAEIFEHARRIGEHFDLYDRALFQTQVESMAWSDANALWTVRTDRGDVIKARYVMTASGPLNRPKLPRIPGINQFKGKLFHTSRWDYNYTGGNPNGELVGLSDKRVAVLGTGATAIQCVPFLARDAQQLYVVQRTPSSVGKRGNAPTDAKWWASLAPGWQRDRMDNFNAIIAGANPDRNLVQDGWTEIFHDLFVGWRPEAGQPLTPAEAQRLAELADLRKGEQMRAWVDAHVDRPEVAEGLKPWYGALCKRPAFNDEYLPAFNRSNVSLIDTRGRGLDEITETAMIFDGVEYPVDCIIFATGFEVGTAKNRSSGVVIHGVEGELLTDHFSNGPRTFHGFYAHGFPNLFLLGSGNNGVKANFTDMLGEQAEHIAGVIAHARSTGARRIEATAEAEASWGETIREKSQPLRAVLAHCTPGYFSGEGDIEKSWSANMYGGGPVEFSALIKDWRDRGDYAGLSIT
ncbi:MAG TPA: NAD(P)/FAD-dependent oxidoreductase [Sphingobium sp.]|uniref:flavin-containing monooxygenase n=1 Tax=Sphingobium sp. TaxID=1912891 RepID=UPI002ED078FF